MPSSKLAGLTKDRQTATAALYRAKQFAQIFAAEPPESGPIKGFKTARDGVVAWQAIVAEWKAKIAQLDADIARLAVFGADLSPEEMTALAKANARRGGEPLDQSVIAEEHKARVAGRVQQLRDRPDAMEEA